MKMFENKKLMFFVPHEDDELNLGGGLLHLKDINKKNCYIVFMTNGNYFYPSKIRIKEALKSTKFLGIPKENVIFLGYPDQFFSEEKHIYNTHSPNIFISNNGRKETIKGNNFSVFKEHQLFNQESILENFIDIIEMYLPDFLFCIDFDSHPDHRCCSLIFDKAMGMILKKNLEYHPKVFKSFAYPTAYKGKKDYNNKEFLGKTEFLTEPFSLCKYQNPYYNWNDRIRFPVGESTLSTFLSNNKLYKNLKKHKSQLILKNAESIINSDQIFWQRRTDNYGINASIKVSSGNSDYLNDFLLLDCENIMMGNEKKPLLKNVSWIPEQWDQKKYILYEFKDPINIEKIKFYQNILSEERIENVKITFNKSIVVQKKLEKIVSTIFLRKENIKTIEIEILDKNIITAGFSEIEILKDELKEEYYFLKCLTEDDFLYNNFSIINKKLNIYFYNGFESFYPSIDDVNIYINNKIVNEQNFQKLKLKKYHLKVALKENENIFDEIIINNYHSICPNKILKVVNKIILKIDIFKTRVYNKIRKEILKFVRKYEE